jgi:hypothetical protein
LDFLVECRFTEGFDTDFEEDGNEANRSTVFEPSDGLSEFFPSSESRTGSSDKALMRLFKRRMSSILNTFSLM